MLFKATLAINVVGLLLIYFAHGQEMGGKGLGCYDQNELCNLNCLMPVGVMNDQNTYLRTKEDIQMCLGSCEVQALTCKDKFAHTQYVDCAYTCAKTYDADLMVCTRSISPHTYGTYGKNLDNCSNIASGRMDDCMHGCYFGQGSDIDRYGQWSPEHEEGHELTSIPKGQWRHPFKDSSVISGIKDARAAAAELSISLDSGSSAEYIRFVATTIISLLVLGIFIVLLHRKSARRTREFKIHHRPTYGSINGWRRL